MNLRNTVRLFKRKDIVFACLLGPISLGFILESIIYSTLEIFRIDVSLLSGASIFVTFLLGLLYYANVVLVEEDLSLENNENVGKISFNKFKGIYKGVILILGIYIMFILAVGLIMLSLESQNNSIGVNIVEVGITPFILTYILIVLVAALIVTLISLVVFCFIKPRKLYKASTQVGVLDVLIVFCIAEIAYNIVGLSTEVVFGEVYSYLAQITLVIVPLAYGKIMKLNIKEVFSFKLPKFKYIILGLLLWLVLSTIGTLISEGICYIYPDAAIGLPDHDSIFQGNIIKNILFTAVNPAICEEILFRGFMLGILLKVLGPKKAIIFTSLIFGLVHAHPLVILEATIVGASLGYILYKSKSIVVPMIIHFANNLLVIIINNYFINI